MADLTPEGQRIVEVAARGYSMSTDDTVTREDLAHIAQIRTRPIKASGFSPALAVIVGAFSRL